MRKKETTVPVSAPDRVPCAEPPHISVVIPTTGRPAAVARCLASLTAVAYPSWDIQLVDQSDDTRTEAVARRLAPRLPGLTYRHLAVRGAARARNWAMARAKGEIVAFLDDDCTVPADWLERVWRAFRRHPDAALIFGAVSAAPHNPTTHYIPAFAPRGERRLRGSLAFLSCEAMSASLAVRRAAIRGIGPVDEQTGAGARLAGEDRDYTYRALRAGQTVVETDAIRVTHYGARAYATGDASRLVRRAAFAQGALDMKALRTGDPAAVIFILAHLGQCLGRIDARHLLMRRRPSNAAWIVLYIRGLVASLAYGVRRDAPLWAEPPEEAPPPAAAHGCERERRRSADRPWTVRTDRGHGRDDASSG